MKHKKHQPEVVDHDIKEIMEDLLARAMFAKTEMCKDEPMTDNPPICLIVVESDDTNPEHDECVEYQNDHDLAVPMHLAMLPLIHKEDVLDAYEDVVKALPTTRAFEFVCLVVEGYGEFADKAETIVKNDDYERGHLEQDYKNNPFSTVREAVIVTAVDWNGTHLWNVISTYRYDDHGVPMFDEPIASVSEVSEDNEDGYGRLGDALVSTSQYMRLALATQNINTLFQQGKKKKGGE